MKKLLVVLAGLLAIAGASYATAAVTAASTTQIVACQLNGLGTIRIVTDASKCSAKYETPISWNTTGPAGPAGAPGKDGKDGMPGTNGTNGTNGAPCLPSNTACVGPAGPAGKDGTNGAKGETGATGPQGPAGSSVTVEPVGSGNAQCPAGGAKFTDANGATAYACSAESSVGHYSSIVRFPALSATGFSQRALYGPIEGGDHDGGTSAAASTPLNGRRILGLTADLQNSLVDNFAQTEVQLWVDGQEVAQCAPWQAPGGICTQWKNPTNNAEVSSFAGTTAYFAVETTAFAAGTLPGGQATFSWHD